MTKSSVAPGPDGRNLQMRTRRRRTATASASVVYRGYIARRWRASKKLYESVPTIEQMEVQSRTSERVYLRKNYQSLDRQCWARPDEVFSSFEDAKEDLLRRLLDDIEPLRVELARQESIYHTANRLKEPAVEE